jgi:hypothetical protein
MQAAAQLLLLLLVCLHLEQRLNLHRRRQWCTWCWVLLTLCILDVVLAIDAFSTCVFIRPDA